MRVLIGLTLALVTLTGYAGTATVSWVHPTQRVDNTALPLSAIGKTFIEWGTCGTGGLFGTFVGSGETIGTGTSYVTPDLAPGTYCFRAYTVTTTGLSSGPSAVVSKAIIAPEQPPKPPALTTIVQTAYELQFSRWGSIRMVKVGTVGIGEPCGALLAATSSYATLTNEQVHIPLRSKYRGGQLYGLCA